MSLRPGTKPLRMPTVRLVLHRLCSEVVDLLQDSTGALQMLEGSGWFDQTEDCKEEGGNFTK